MRARALGQARVARRAARAGAGQTSWGWAARPVQGRLSENTRICHFFIFCNFPIFFVIFWSCFCNFPIFCHVLVIFLSFHDFLSFFVIFLSFLSFFVVFFCHFLSFPETSVIFCHWGSHFFVISRNLCHFFVVGAVIFFQVRNLCHFFVVFVSFPEPLSFCQSFLVSPLPGPWLCQYVRIPGQTIQRPCLLMEG